MAAGPARAVLLAGGARAADPPHILFFLGDAIGDVGYHESEIATPNLDQLAAQGVRLEQYYVQPGCTPTRAALLTGRYPIRYGLQEGVLWPWTRGGLPLSERTLAEELRALGYRTVLIGKWHLGMSAPEYLPLAGGTLDPERHLDGVDAWPAIAEGAATRRTEILLNANRREAGLRRGDWKLVRRLGVPARTELFDLARDPRERRNLAAARPDKVAELGARLDAYRRSATEPRIHPTSHKPLGFRPPPVWGDAPAAGDD